MRDFIVKYKTTIGLICGVLTFIVIGKYHIHYTNKNLCPGTQYEVINGVTYCKCSESEKQVPGKCEDKYK